MKRHIVLLLLALLGAPLMAPRLTAHAQEAASTPTPPPEPPAPQATAAVQKLLDEGEPLLASRQLPDAMKASDRALAAARDASDAAGEALSLRLRARALEAQSLTEPAAGAWRETATAWERVGDGPGQIEALAGAARLLPEAQSQEADALIARAVALGRAEAKRPRAAVEAFKEAGAVSYGRGRLGQTRALFEAALFLHEKLAPNSAEVAEGLTLIGGVAFVQGDLATAKSSHAQALAIRQNLAPASLDVAESFNELGTATQQQGDLAGARLYYEQALAIYQASAPGSIEVAMVLNNLGALAEEQGDKERAKSSYEQALAIQQQLEPRSLDAAVILDNLGDVAHAQGRLATARSYYDLALDIRQEKAPGSMDVARSLSHLGNLARQLGDFRAAKWYHEQALATRQQRASGTADTAASLGNLGNVAWRSGEFVAAKDYYQRALAMYERLAPNSLDVGKVLGNLGIVAWSERDLTSARSYHEQALSIFKKLAPGSLDVATSLTNLGTVVSGQGDPALSKWYHDQALAITEKLAPGSLHLALCHSNLSYGARQQGNWTEALRLAQQAWQIVRQQAGAVFGDEGRQAFGSAMAGYAANLIQAQLALRHTTAAFFTLEESCAQALQQLLLERHGLLTLTSDTRSATYQEAVAARNLAEANLSRFNTRLQSAKTRLQEAEQARPTPPDLGALRADVVGTTQEFQQAEASYREARRTAEARWRDIQRANPRAFPPPLTPQQATQALPSDSLYVAFLVGEQQTHLFLLRRGPLPAALSAYTLNVKEKTLKALVAALHDRLKHRTPALSNPTAASRALFTTLFPRAAQPALLRAKRLLISPDGTLWQVPFAALVTNAQGPPRYLGLEKPLTYTPSLTLFAQARRDTPRLARGRRPTALIVGNPAFASPTTSPSVAPEIAAAAPRPLAPGGERGEVLRGSETLPDLPEAAQEAAAIATLYGTRFLTGKTATEAVVRERAGSADVIHLATHGRLNAHRGMSSGVLFAAPGSAEGAEETARDGVLQAWEIQSQLALRAELVVLSACETGLGQTVRSEGIVGLTRALQAAGVRSIVVSHWRVRDASTRRLMVTFHQKLRAGVAKDEALRQAMAAVRRDPKRRDPRYWSAFFLVGDPANPTLGAPGKPIGLARHSSGVESLPR